MSKVFRNWLELIRLPAVFSAPADVLAAFALGQTFGIELSIGTMLSLVAVALLLYMAGMISNDIFDLAVDTHERPERPLPSGRVSVSSAWCVAVGMQGLALYLAYCQSPVSGHAAFALCALTYLYNGVTKAQSVGPFVMGLCRGANVCLGLSVLPGFGLESGSWLMVLAIIWYIWRVTMVSRYEVPVDGEESRARRAIIRLRLSGLVLLLYVPLATLPLWGVLMLMCSTLIWLNVDVLRLRLRAIEGPVRFEVIRGLQGILVTYTAVCIAFNALGIAMILCACLLAGKRTAKWFYAT